MRTNQHAQNSYRLGCGSLLKAHVAPSRGFLMYLPNKHDVHVFSGGAAVGFFLALCLLSFLAWLAQQ